MGHNGETNEHGHDTNTSTLHSEDVTNAIVTSQIKPRPPSLRIPIAPVSSTVVDFIGSQRFDLQAVTLTVDNAGTWSMARQSKSKSIKDSLDEPQIEGVLKTISQKSCRDAMERSRWRIFCEIKAYRRIQEAVPGAVPPLLHTNEMASCPHFIVERMGHDLFDVLRVMNGNLPSFKRVRDILMRLAWILSCLHEAGISHNDLKPENVVEGRGIGSEIVYLIDLESSQYRDEVASDEDTFLTSTDEKTPTYSSPEAWRGSKLPLVCWGAEDAFGLGRIAHVLLTGEPLSVPSDNGMDRRVDWADYIREYIANPTNVLSMDHLADTMEACLRETRKGLAKDVSDKGLCRVTNGLLHHDPLKRMTCLQAYHILSESDPFEYKKRKRPAF